MASAPRSGSSSSAQDGLGERRRDRAAARAAPSRRRRPAPACPRARWPITGVLARERLADRAGDAEPRVGGVDDERRRRRRICRDVVAMAEREHAPVDAARARPLGDARRRGAAARPRRAAARAARAGVHVAPSRRARRPAAPGAHADLGDERVLGGQAELARGSAPPSTPGWKRVEVGAGVDDLDLVGGHAGGDEPALDRLAHGDDRVHAAARVAERGCSGRAGSCTPRLRTSSARAPDEAGEQRERAGAALVRVRDLDALAGGSAGPAARPRAGRAAGASGCATWARPAARQRSAHAGARAAWPPLT